MDIISKQFKILQTFLQKYNTYELGSLQIIIRLLVQDPSQENYMTLTNNIKQMVANMLAELKQNPKNKGKKLEYLTMIILDSLIFDIYAKHIKDRRQNQMNQSLYNQSVYSQQSMSCSVITEKSISNVNMNIKNFNQLLQHLISDPQFFNSLSKLISQARLTRDIKTQVTLLFETLEYIIEKEKIDDKLYQENKQILDKYLIKPSPMTTKMPGANKSGKERAIDGYDQVWSEVNKVIFSNKLDKILKILSFTDKVNQTDTQKEVHLALGRIYFAAFGDKKRANYRRKQFQNIQHYGSDMISSLFNYYIKFNISEKKKTLFSQAEEDSGKPLFLFIINYMQLLFMPQLHAFSDIFDKQIMIHYTSNTEEFYNNIQEVILKQVIPFIENLPSEFTNIFTQLYEFLLARDQQQNDQTDPIFPLKHLFFNRFFLNPSLKLLINPNITQQAEYQDAVNKIQSLLYKNPEFINIQSYKMLGEKLLKTFTDMVTYHDVQTPGSGLYNYYITDPILRHDYNFLQEIIKLIPFSPSEEKSHEIIDYKSERPERNRDKPLNQQYINNNNSSNNLVPSYLQKQNLNNDPQNKFIADRDIQTPKFSELTPLGGAKQQQQQQRENDQQNLLYQQQNINQNINNINSEQYRQEQQKIKQQEEKILQLKQELQANQDLLSNERNFYQQAIKDSDQQQQFSIFQEQFDKQQLQFQQQIRKQQEETQEIRKQNYSDKTGYKQVLDQLLDEKKQRVLIEDDKAQLVDQISQLEDRNAFLRQTVKVRYPTSLETINSTLETNENILKWKQEQDKEILRQEIEEQNLKKQKGQDEFYKIQQQLKQRQNDIYKDSVNYQIHQKTTMNRY